MKKSQMKNLWLIKLDSTHFFKVILKFILLQVNALLLFLKTPTAQKMKFSIKDFFSKCDQIRRFLFNADKDRINEIAQMPFSQCADF